MPSRTRRRDQRRRRPRRRRASRSARSSPLAVMTPVLRRTTAGAKAPQADQAMQPVARPAAANMPRISPTCSVAMLGAQRAAQQGHARRRRRRAGEIDVEALVEQRLPHRRAGLQVGHDHRDDRRLRLVGAEREAELPSARRGAACEFSHRCARLSPPCISLRIEVAAVATTDGGKRGGEDIGPADQPQDLELGMVGDAEAADRADRLGKGADDEVDVVDHALRFGDAAAVARR